MFANEGVAIERSVMPMRSFLRLALISILAWGLVSDKLAFSIDVVRVFAATTKVKEVTSPRTPNFRKLHRVATATRSPTIRSRIQFDSRFRTDVRIVPPRPAQLRLSEYLLAASQLPPIHPRRCATQPPIVEESRNKSGKRKAEDGNGQWIIDNVQTKRVQSSGETIRSSDANSQILNPKSSRPRRATRNHETSNDSKKFREYSTDHKMLWSRILQTTR
ncbi:MAG TPA: hypothetical protein VLA12_09295, partial [Planctomycetaceae bacterium]|nr:hypothetical protein [Planctomycetaceae bacterium]